MIDEVLKRFVPGDEVLIAVYPGNVMAIPDFTITPPATISLPTTGTTASAGSMKVACNQQFLGSQVTLTTLADTLDAEQPDASTGTLTGAHADHLHAEPRDAVARVRPDRQPHEHDHRERPDRDLHALGPGPGRQRRT